MDNLMDIVKGRRSIRRYEEKEISEGDLQKILESVQWAPSWANSQCWEIIVIKDPAIKAELQEKSVPKNAATKAIVEAPIVLAICGKKNIAGCYKGEAVTKFGDWMMFDLGIASQNICLVAHSLGLGTVIVGMFDHDQAAKTLKVGQDYEVVVLIPVGYPAKDSQAPKRREINEFVHNDTF